MRLIFEGLFMVLGGLSPGWVAGIALVASGMLVALHFLRIQPRQQRVLTLLFWRQMQQKHQTPSLFDRFRNLWTLVLLLLIVAMISVALLGIKRTPGDERVVMVVDAGMSMAASTKNAGVTRMDEARALALRLADAAGSQPMAVVVADPLPRVVAGFDEPAVLRERAIKDLHAAEGPSAGRDALVLARALLSDQSKGRILWITDRREMPAGMTLNEPKPIERYSVGDVQENAAIVSSVYAMPASGSAEGALRVRVAYWGSGEAALQLQASAGSAKVFNGAQKVASGRTAEFVIPHAADGAKIQLTLSGVKGIAADDVADVVLPKLDGLHFAIERQVPRALRLALGALGTDARDDGAIMVTDDVKKIGQGPAIVVVGQGPQAVNDGEIVKAVRAQERELNLNFEQAHVGKGPDLRGVADSLEPVLTAGDAVVAAVQKNKSGKVLLISSALFAPGANVTTRAAFVAFLDQMVREIRPVQNGTPVTISLVRAQADPVWAEKIEQGGAVTVVRGDRENSDLTQVSDSQAPAVVSAGSGMNLEPFEILLGISLLLLVTEAFLSIRGRIV